MSEWQPIKTIPRDGRLVLIYGSDFLGQKYVALANFDGQHWNGAGKSRYSEQTFNAWHPLPELPNSTKSLQSEESKNQGPDFMLGKALEAIDKSIPYGGEGGI